MAGTEAQNLVADIEEVSGEFAALSAAAALLGDRIGDDAVDELKKFGENTTDLGNSLSTAFTNIAASIANNLNPALEELNRRLENARLQGIGERIIREGGPDAERIRQAGAGGGLEGLERQRNEIRKILKERERAIRDSANAELSLDARVQASLKAYELQNQVLKTAWSIRKSTTS